MFPSLYKNEGTLSSLPLLTLNFLGVYLCFEVFILPIFCATGEVNDKLHSEAHDVIKTR